MSIEEEEEEFKTVHVQQSAWYLICVPYSLDK